MQYREIFRTYYRGPDDFDEEIVDAVVYFRENRLNFYREPEIEVGSVLPDSRVYRLDNTETSVYKELGTSSDFERTIIAGFSMS